MSYIANLYGKVSRAMRSKLLVVLMLVLAFAVGYACIKDLRSGVHSGTPLNNHVQLMEVKPGTQGMIAAINDIEDYLNGSRIIRGYAALKPQLHLIRGVHNDRQARRHLKIARVKLTKGDTEAALEILEDIASYAKTGKVDAETQKQLDEITAISFMRLGEQQNCVINPHASACIIPLNKEAIHKLREGSSAAAEIYQNTLLKKAPDDYASKWLLNIAHMTLGQYPKGVPKEHLIPFPGWIDNYHGPTFSNISESAGVDNVTRAGSVVLEDFNNDNLIDIFVTSWGLSGGIKYYLRKADGTFHDATEEAGLAALQGGLNIIHGDYNNDGLSDIYIIRGAWKRERGHIPNSLLKNNGDGTFSDVTVAAGILDFYPTIISAFADLNNDGWLDLVVTNERSGKKKKSTYNPSQIYINNKDGTFSDLAAQSGFVLDCNAKGLAIADYDNNRFPDIYVSCQKRKNYLFANYTSIDNLLSFEDISAKSNSNAHDSSFSSWSWDYNNDGLEDIFVAGYGWNIKKSASGMSGSTTITDTASMARSFAGFSVPLGHSVLYQNNGDGTFSDVTAKVELNRPVFAMGANFGDFDNDGWLDIYLGTGGPKFRSIYPNLALQNMNGTSFRDITTSSGLGHIQKGHGIAFADMDEDGDQDIFAEMGGAVTGDTFQNALFENLSSKNKWIKLKLVGVQSNRDAIGARIKVEIMTPDGKSRSIFRTVGSSVSFGSSSFRQEVGLGLASSVKRITITWPSSGVVQTFNDVPSNKTYRIFENKSNLELVNVSELPFPRFGQNKTHLHH